MSLFLFGTFGGYFILTISKSPLYLFYTDYYLASFYLRLFKSLLLTELFLATGVYTTTVGGLSSFSHYSEYYMLLDRDLTFFRQLLATLLHPYGVHFGMHLLIFGVNHPFLSSSSFVI